MKARGPGQPGTAESSVLKSGKALPARNLLAICTFHFGD